MTKKIIKKARTGDIDSKKKKERTDEKATIKRSN